MGKTTSIRWTDETLSLTLRQRFWNNIVVKTSRECWLWRAGRFSDGLRYGQFRVGAKKMKAHRVAFLLRGGVLTSSKPKVLHTCDNPLCCNPRHLYAGTDADNARDRDMRHRGARIGASLPKEMNPAAKLVQSQVDEIRRMAARGITQRRLSRLFGICESQIGNIVRRTSWV